MVYIPSNEVDNMIDNLVTKSSSSVLHVAVNPDTDNGVELPVSCINRLANYFHMHYFSKDVFVGDVEILQLIREVYNFEARRAVNPQKFALFKLNKLEITYHNDKIRHKYKLFFDDQWKLLSDPNELLPQNTKPNLRMLFNYKSVLAMNQPERLLDFHDFVRVFEFLPLIDYLCGFECIKAPQPINQRTDINFVVIFCLMRHASSPPPA